MSDNYSKELKSTQQTNALKHYSNSINWSQVSVSFNTLCLLPQSFTMTTMPVIAGAVTPPQKVSNTSKCVKTQLGNQYRTNSSR
mmetsp:Transcript_2888/g.4076  ORF Transcript_2888/g.4076 Transcript_2888/m.4076 type:complete len:84 (-) Transcript_2888:112-363(-)